MVFIPTSWLFVRGHESIRLLRSQTDSLMIHGPGPERIRSDFADADRLESYLADLLVVLEEGGWQALGQGYERRSQGDRRKNRRETPDRRNRDQQEANP